LALFHHHPHRATAEQRLATLENRRRARRIAAGRPVRLHVASAFGRSPGDYPLWRTGAGIAGAGLAWRLPPPLETVVPVDLRLRTTSSGLQDVGTRDGLRVIMQSYVAWQVPADSSHITRFLRAVQNQPDEAARQIATFAGSAMETGSSRFASAIW
jgi:membrane protease subunit HflC